MSILLVPTSQLADLFCLLEYQKIRILQDDELWESQIDLPSIQLAIFPPNIYVTENESSQQPYGEVLHLAPFHRRENWGSERFNWPRSQS